MSATDNKALSRRYFETVSKDNLSIFNEVFDDNFVSDDPAVPDTISSVEEAKHHFATLLQAFPDMKYRIIDQVTDENSIVTYWSAHATHTGSYYGIPPTGKEFTITGMNLWRIAHGKVVEGWVSRDDLGMMRQLGLVSM